jgi:hypothetical protein
MSYSIEDFAAVVKQQALNHPHSFWAKKFNEEIHIPALQEPGEFSKGTLCGSVAYMLGNNYAPEKVHDYPICPLCLQMAYDDVNHRIKILKEAGI